MNREIKKFEYDDIKCFMNNDAVCPYCGYENYIEPESYGGQDEETVEECGNCGKTFVHKIDYSITFTSEPYENWYLGQRESLLKRIKRYEQDSEDELYKSYLNHLKKELEDLDTKAKELLEVENEQQI